jgi:hypothetical protein
MLLLFLVGSAARSTNEFHCDVTNTKVMIQVDTPVVWREEHQQSSFQWRQLEEEAGQSVKIPLAI